MSFPVGTRIREINQGWQGVVIAVITIKPIVEGEVPVRWDLSQKIELVSESVLEKVI